MDIDFKSMFEKAKKAGLTNETTMWDSIDLVNDFLDTMEESNPKEYWKFMRKMHGLLFKRHYGEEFAMWDVSQISYTDKEGKKHNGAYWTCEQIEEATKAMAFPPDTTKWDKYVAFNAMKSDMDKILPDEKILQAAHDFYFADEDWGKNTKIWDYMMCKHM